MAEEKAKKKAADDAKKDAKPADRTISENDLAQHIPVIRNYLRKIVRRDEIDDAVQTVLARALENLHRYRGDSSPRVWLLGIARNVGYEQARARQRGPVLASREQDESNNELGPGIALPEPTQEDVLGRKQQQALALQAMDQLNLDEKLALLVTYVDGVPGPEAAKNLGISCAAFRQRLSRARQAMARELERVMNSSAPANAAETLNKWEAALDPKSAASKAAKSKTDRADVTQQ